MMGKFNAYALGALAVLASGGTAQAQVTPPPLTATTPQDDELVVDVVGGISAPMPIIIPAMPTSQTASTPAGSTDELGRQLAQIVDDDLRGTGLFKTVGPNAARPIAYGEVTAPDYASWDSYSAQALVQGYVRANGNGTLTVGCYLYDITAKTELIRQGFVVPPADWRRAGHQCADAIYTRLPGEGPYFDSQVVYISETGPKNRRIKRLAIMDQDGANHRFLTNGQTILLTPRLRPDPRPIASMSYAHC